MNSSLPTWYALIDSPIGTLTIAATEQAICALKFPQERHPTERPASWRYLPLDTSAAVAGDERNAPTATPITTDKANSARRPSAVPPAPTGSTASAGNALKPSAVPLSQTDKTAAAGTPPRNPPDDGPAAHLLREAARQLREYFAGQRREFSLPLAPQGTAFQQQVWQALQRIPHGHTWSYAELARHIGRPKAMRAVGAANGRNPIPILIPCHRVIGADGSLVGFGGGLPTKVALLRLESDQHTLASPADAHPAPHGSGAP